MEVKFKILLCQLIFCACFCPIKAQQPEDFKVIDFGNKHAVSAIEISPDNKTIAIGTAGGAVYFWDIESKKVIRQIEITGHPWGPYLKYSADGKYLLLLQQFFTDWSINKDRPSKAEILDISSGNILVKIDGVHSAAISPDNKSLVGLKHGEVIFWNILSGQEERRFKPENATNSVAVSPDGNIIAVSQKPTEKDLLNIPSIRTDKKAIKEALKFREVTVFYDAKTFEKKLVVNDIFDIIFSMNFSPDGSSLYLFNAPNTRFRVSSSVERNGYIQTVNTDDGSATRVIFPTGATEPQYKESQDRTFFATTTIESRFRVLNAVNVSDRTTGSTLKNFIIDLRVTEDVHTGRAAFEFLPDNQNILMGYGSKLAIWKIQ